MSRIAHFNIRVKDAAKSVAFYQRLGLKPAGALQISPGYYLLYLAADDNPNLTIEMTVNESAPADYDRRPGSGHLALAVGDLDRVLRELAEHGIQPESPPFRPGDRVDLRVCFVVDPDGVRIELIDGFFPTPADPIPKSLNLAPT